MKTLFKTLKFWEIIFIILIVACASPLFIEFLPLAILPLIVFNIIISVFSFKQKNYLIILVNLLLLLASMGLYIYLW